MTLVSKDDIDAWLAHPVTQALKRRLTAAREEIKEDLACGAYVDDTEFKTALRTAGAVRHCEVLQTLLNLEEGDLSYEE